MKFKIILSLIICSFTVSSFCQEKLGVQKKSEVKKVTGKAVIVDGNTNMVKTETAVINQPSEKGNSLGNEESLFYKLSMCESKIAHNPTEKLNREHSELRERFVNYVKNTSTENLSAPEKSRYMSYMKEINNISEYNRMKQSLRK